MFLFKRASPQKTLTLEVTDLIFCHDQAILVLDFFFFIIRQKRNHTTLRSHSFGLYLEGSRVLLSNIWLTIKIWKKRKIESQKKLLKSTLEKLIIVLQRKFDCLMQQFC